MKINKKYVIIAVLLLLIAVFILILALRKVAKSKLEKTRAELEWGKSVPTYCPYNYAEDISGHAFSLSDMSSKDGVTVPYSIRGNANEVLGYVDIIRSYIKHKYGNNVDVILSSGFRSISHNADIGGEPNSRHCCAEATDLHPVGITASQLYNAILELINLKLIKNGGVGKYDTFVHYDIHTARRWNG